MQIIYGLKNIRKYPRLVVALGVFDGVHLGHRQILKAVVKKADQIKGSSLVLTFWPHPRGKKSLYSLEHRLRLIEEIGIDICIVIDFNRRFSQIRAEGFVKDIIFKKIRARYIFVGKNFKFGKNAQGTYKTLRKLSAAYDYKLKVFSVKKINNLPISSTHIRSLIDRGRLKNTERLLSRPVSILGTVIKGDSLGKKLGFPTANIKAHHEIIPPIGVYAVKIVIDNRIFKGVCYIGTKPTFKEKASRSIEVHIFKLKKNLYNKYLEIQFIKKIRREYKFFSVERLKREIKKDIKKSKHLLSSPLMPTTIYAHLKVQLTTTS